MKPISLLTLAALAIAAVAYAAQPEPKPQPKPEPVKYQASKRSDKYHLPSCEWAQKIAPYNKVVFSSPAEAESKGFKACRVCRPKGK